MPSRADDERFLCEALRIASDARGISEPNPNVGCVIVRHDTIIGRGHTSAFGGPHAEACALDQAGDARGTTAYVTLEPCCYTGHGKRTPPCVPKLIEAGIRRVVIGCIDPHPRVAGEGVRQLREAGLDVVIGVCESEAKQLIAPFVARLQHGRPYVTLKWAVSRDGKVAGRQGRPVRITNAASTATVQALRGRCDAIAVGTNTIVNDNPQLTARGPNPPRLPVRIVFSNTLAFPANRRALDPAGGATIVFTTPSAPPEAMTALRSRGAEVVALTPHDNGRGGVRFSIADALAELGKRDMTHLLVEPGPKLARDLIESNHVDRIWEIRGQDEIGEDGLDAPANPFPPVGALDLDGDLLVESLNPASDVYFGPHASADFQLTQADHAARD